MHLWPSMRIRDSFKIGYLKKLEWNLDRMNSQKNQSQQEKLLDDQENVVDGKPLSNYPCLSNSALLFREAIMILSCCYCCFCCGACVDEGEE
ncbi:uncharacterized protein [Euphorbia lathyris]|uniref:uncharacterized protein n=1 Tax=Euphorbia lathyris TaxID=212925 RepID=UPI00331337C5